MDPYDRNFRSPCCGPYITAYAIAVKHGYTGSEEEWVKSLGSVLVVTVTNLQTTEENEGTFSYNSSWQRIEEALALGQLVVLDILGGGIAWMTHYIPGKMARFATAPFRVEKESYCEEYKILADGQGEFGAYIIGSQEGTDGYVKPEGGIPYADLAASVQDLLAPQRIHGFASREEYNYITGEFPGYVKPDDYVWIDEVDAYTLYAKPGDALLPVFTIPKKQGEPNGGGSDSPQQGGDFKVKSILIDTFAGSTTPQYGAVVAETEDTPYGGTAVLRLIAAALGSGVRLRGLAEPDRDTDAVNLGYLTRYVSEHGGYTKPSDGIPIGDLSQGVQSLLRFAGSSVQFADLDRHDTSNEAHMDLRVALQGLADRINAILNSDDTTLDQLSEIVAYIKTNKTLIDAITTSKVSVSDIVNNLTTNLADRPLSAAQGVVIREAIDALFSREHNIIVSATPTANGSYTVDVPTSEIAAVNSAGALVRLYDTQTGLYHHLVHSEMLQADFAGVEYDRAADKVRIVRYLVSSRNTAQKFEFDISSGMSEEDKQEIVSSVLAALPEWEGGNY